MTSPWQMLIGNLAVVALFVLGWGHARYWLRNVSGLYRSALLGLAMGLGAICSMAMAAQVQPGIYIDLRLSLISVASFFGGPIAAIVSSILALGWRASMGGAGVLPGLFNIVLIALISLGARALVSRRGPVAWHGVILALVVTVASSIGVVTLPPDIMQRALVNIVLPLGLLNVVAMVLASLVFLQARRIAAERSLMAAALIQAPDFTYVKDRHGRFAVVNNAVADLHGYSSPNDMIGKSDFDIAPPERAQILFDREQEIISSGEPLLDFEEQLVGRDGKNRWYSTDKVPIHASNGEMLGIAGVTRDITDDKQLRQDLIDSRNLLSYAMAEMSDGLAMFDNDGHIEFCNAQYSAYFPFSGQYRKPGAHLRDILKVVIESGEQISAPQDHTDEWIDTIVDNLHRESEEEVNLLDGRWLQVRTRPTAEGKTLVVVTDITRIKQTELALHSATHQLKELVRTDSLTGLLNRRAFDDAIETETSRSARAASAMSLLLIDVDHFKAYNDHYGHPAGDECLRKVSDFLRSSLRRPADMVARYGGEEFVAILPDTDEDGAYLVAEAFRKALAGARLPHKGCERGYVTASVGVATYMQDNLDRVASEIIQTADEALYSAKAAGRDRVFGTRVMPKHKRYAQR